MRAEQFLPDHVNQIEIDGTTVRKGTVAAFLFNARLWNDPQASEAGRTAAMADIAAALPALRAIGLFDVLAIRDDALREWVEGR